MIMYRIMGDSNLPPACHRPPSTEQNSAILHAYTDTIQATLNLLVYDFHTPNSSGLEMERHRGKQHCTRKDTTSTPLALEHEEGGDNGEETDSTGRGDSAGSTGGGGAAGAGGSRRAGGAAGSGVGAGGNGGAGTGRELLVCCERLVRAGAVRNMLASYPRSHAPSHSSSVLTPR